MLTRRRSDVSSNIPSLKKLDDNAYKKTKRRAFYILHGQNDADLSGKLTFLEHDKEFLFHFAFPVVKKDESEGARNRGLAGVLKGGDGESSKDFRPRDYSVA
ncbi:hypothetical protein Tco_1297039 [Tanacetum coccineum]